MRNSKAQMIQVLVYIYGILAVLYAVFLCIVGRNLLSGFMAIVMAMIPMILLMAFAEIVELLDKINRKLTVLVPDPPEQIEPSQWEQVAMQNTQEEKTDL